MSASSSDLKLALEISADAAKATKALIDTKANVTDLTQTLSVAQTESNALKQAFDEAAQKTDSLGTQTALAKKALNDMATNGIAKTHADYKALEGEIANMEAELKRLLPELRNHEKAYQNSSTALEALRNRLNQATDSVQAQESALRRAGVDVGNLAREYDRLSKEASSAASLDMARGVLDVKPHQAVRAEIQQTRDAYETLRSSGQLSSAELAQAAVKAEEKIAELHRSTNGWADSLGRAKLAFVEAAGAGLGMKTLIAEAVEFETGLMAVEKTTGLSRRQLEGLGETLKHLSGELPIAAGGLAKIAEQGGQLGIASNQLENFTRLAAKMATAFDMSAEASGEAVAKLKNNFRLGLDAVEKLGDAVNVLGNNTAAKEASIIDTLTRIGGTATQFGLAADQAAALSSAMLGLGMESEVAGTAINALLSKLQTARVGSKDFQEGLQQLGLSADQMAEMVRANPQRALTDFLHLLEKVDAQSRAEILTRMFGEEHQDEISRLVGAL
ncbi:phage tail tape measure protein, partial [Methylomagnum sp.]